MSASSTVSDERSGLRNVHALSGVVPIGFFLFEHTVLAANALRGQDAFERSVVFVDNLPFWKIADALLILAPLAFHALYGVYLIANPSERAKISPYSVQWARLSRVTAMLSFAFIAYHFYELRIPKWFGGVAPRSQFTSLVNDLSSTVSVGGAALPLVGLFYLLGIAATAFHFACGMWGFLARKRYVVVPLAKRRAAYGAGVIGFALFALSAVGVVSLATGAPALPHGNAQATPVCAP